MSGMTAGTASISTNGATIKVCQGVRSPALEAAMAGDPFFRLLKNPTATAEAFEGGWFHTGDLAVWDPDGYVEIKDPSKDIIISGGENISPIEVEDVLYRDPAVMETAVVARPDEKLGRDAVRLRGPAAPCDGDRS